MNKQNYNSNYSKEGFKESRHDEFVQIKQKISNSYSKL